MKPIRSVLIIAATSLLTVSTLFGQTTPIRPATATKARDTMPASQDAKEKSEDAALLEQLDAGGQDVGNVPKPAQNQWIQGGALPMVGGRAGAGSGGMSYRMANVVTRQGGAVPKPVLVRTSEPEAKAQAALAEDLSVMAHILDKAVEELPGGQRHGMTAMGIDVVSWSGSIPMRSLYLDNYGAVFFLSVSFPLVAPPEKHEEEKPAGDSAWEDARQELYGQRLPGAMAGEAGEDYSQDKVDKLKDVLLEGLKNATNIRGLKPEEFVTIWVSGGASSGNGRFRVFRTNPAGTLGNLVAPEQPGPPARRTILTIRATKTEIDAYAEGKLALEEFHKHAQITAYTGDAAGGATEAFVSGGYGGRRF